MNEYIGADPELFVVNTANKFISSIGKFGGTKVAPKPLGENCYVQEDNVAVEFNIPPSASKKEFISSINYALGALEKRAHELGLNLAIVPSANFEDDQLKHKNAREFGCEPDTNAWTLHENKKPHCDDASLRSAGGHVHVGCQRHAPFDIARAMDLFLGVPSIAVDSDLNRRQLYGKAGAYRHKSYGVEYRTLSNFWLKTDKLKEWVFEQTQAAVRFLDIGNRLLENTQDARDIQSCINNTDLSIMQGLIKKYGLDPAI